MRRSYDDIIHIYKGYKIKKVIKHYASGNETFYLIDGINDIFTRLKDAKAFIDRAESQTKKE